MTLSMGLAANTIYLETIVNDTPVNFGVAKISLKALALQLLTITVLVIVNEVYVQLYSRVKPVEVIGSTGCKFYFRKFIRLSFYASQIFFVVGSWTVLFLYTLSFNPATMQSWQTMSMFFVFIDIFVVPLLKALFDAARSKSVSSFSQNSDSYELYIKPNVIPNKNLESKRERSIFRSRKKSEKKKVTLESDVLHPDQEEEAAENILARKKWQQRLSLEETLIDIGGYVLNLVSLWIISLAMFPGGLGQNAKYLADRNLRQPLVDKRITTVNDLWMFIDNELIDSVHPEPTRYNGEYLKFSEKQFAADQVNYR